MGASRGHRGTNQHRVDTSTALFYHSSRCAPWSWVLRLYYATCARVYRLFKQPYLVTIMIMVVIMTATFLRSILTIVVILVILAASVWYGIVRYRTVWYGMVWYGAIWYAIAWYGMVWYGMVWYDMI